jgi:hypothetical protein
MSFRIERSDLDELIAGRRNCGNPVDDTLCDGLSDCVGQKAHDGEGARHKSQMQVRPEEAQRETEGKKKGTKKKAVALDGHPEAAPIKELQVPMEFDFFLPLQLVPPHVEIAGMSAVNQLLCGDETTNLNVFWYGVTPKYRFEYYDVLRDLFGEQIDAHFGLTGDRRFHAASPEFYKYRVMTVDSFLAIMKWLGWEENKQYYCVSQKRNETLFTLPGVEHHVSFSWNDPDIHGAKHQNPDGCGFSLEQVRTTRET